jgi:hypothetical protein
MEKKIISYSLEHLQDSKFQLEMLTDDGVTLFQGDITDCQKHINYFIYDNPNAKFGIEPNEVLNLNNMEKKQTAVEWLEEKLSTSSSDELVGNINNWFEQAKQMEKEEIMKVVMDFGWSKEKADKYYNETYGGKS